MRSEYIGHTVSTCCCGCCCQAPFPKSVNVQYVEIRDFFVYEIVPLLAAANYCWRLTTKIVSLYAIICQRPVISCRGFSFGVSGGDYNWLVATSFQLASMPSNNPGWATGLRVHAANSNKYFHELAHSISAFFAPDWKACSWSIQS